MDDTVRRLVALCGIFAESTGRSISTVSRHATGSGETIARLTRGHAITTRRAERAFRFLSDNWPDPVEWPADTPRPALSSDPVGEPESAVAVLGDGVDALSAGPLSNG